MPPGTGHDCTVECVGGLLETRVSSTAGEARERSGVSMSREGSVLPSGAGEDSEQVGRQVRVIF